MELIVEWKELIGLIFLGLIFLIGVNIIKRKKLFN